jgi:hypothetical protein
MGRIKARTLRRILSRHPDFRCPLYIETGLHTGRRIRVCAPHFERVHGIELDEHWYAVCARAMADSEHVTIHHGDTRELLPEILSRYPETPCFIHLDAHFCQTDPPIRKSEFPLWDELAAIRDRPVRDIVSVDDVHTFGKVREDLKYAGDAVEWEGVTTASLLDYFGERVHDSRTVSDAFIIWKLPNGEDAPPPPGSKARPRSRSRRAWWWPLCFRPDTLSIRGIPRRPPAAPSRFATSARGPMKPFRDEERPILR